MTHPLQNAWVFWEHRADGDWNSAMREVCEFNTVEDFWRYFAYLPRPSEVFNDGSSTKKEVNGRVLDGFSLFKKGIKPAWEDVANRSGSELVCRKTMNTDVVDLYWENLVLALIGETIDQEDQICGVRVVDKSKRGSARTLFKFELWLRTNSPEVGEILRVRMLDVLADNEGGAKINPKNLPEFQYKPHNV